VTVLERFYSNLSLRLKNSLKSGGCTIWQKWCNGTKNKKSIFSPKQVKNHRIWWFFGAANAA